jgi:hypothetical protein
VVVDAEGRAGHDGEVLLLEQVLAEAGRSALVDPGDTSGKA